MRKIRIKRITLAVALLMGANGSLYAQSAVTPQSTKIDAPKFAPKNAMEYTATYKGKFWNMNWGQVKLKIVANDQGYHASYDLDRDGIVQMWTSRHAHGFSTGQFDSVSVDYFYDYVFENDNAFQERAMLKAAEIKLWSHPILELKHEVKLDDVQNTIDPIAAIMQLGFVDVPEGLNPCHRTIRIFDGKFRYDVKMFPKGEKEFKRVKKGRFQGQTYKCGLRQVKIAGYKAKDLKEKSVGSVYLAKVPDEIRNAQFSYVPVYIETRIDGRQIDFAAKNPSFTTADGTTLNMGRR